MDKGSVVGIYIAPQESAAISSLPEVTAVAGKGLEGDRYFDMPDMEPKQEITLFTKEWIDTTNKQTGIGVTYEDMRRNVMVEGLDLNELIGRRFFVGEVEVEAIKANPPCNHLQNLSGKPLLKNMVKTSGGIRGRIVSSGTIRVGDPVHIAE
jgi:MOSC domain-containing protein YiiM